MAEKLAETGIFIGLLPAGEYWVGGESLQVIAGADPADPVTAGADARVQPNYASVLLPDGLRSTRIGVLNQAWERNSTDPEVRKEHYRTALQRIADQAYWAPMFSYNTNYVSTAEVSYTPTADEVLRFHTMTWN